MPLNVPLVNTFGPFRQSIGQLTNALQDAPRMQMERLQLGQAQRAVGQQAQHDAENRELVQLVQHIPSQAERHRIAIQFLESKGRFEEAQKYKDIDEQLRKAIEGGNPKLAYEMSLRSQGLNPEEHPFQEKLVPQAKDTALVGATSQQVIVPARPSPPKPLSPQESAYQEAYTSLTAPGRDVQGIPKPAMNPVLARRELDKPAVPPTERPDVGDWAQAFTRDRGRPPTETEIDAHAVKMRPPKSETEAGSYLPVTDAKGSIIGAWNPKSRKFETPPPEMGGGARRGAQPFEERRAGTNARSGLRALNEMETMLKDKSILTQAAIPGSLGARKFAAARKEVVDVLTRLRTGAALNKEEEEFYTSQAPTLLDLSDPDAIAYKIKIFRDLFTDLSTGGVGNIETPASDKNPAATSLPSGIKVTRIK